MFRDREEELQRLQEQLLQDEEEETKEQVEESEDILDDDLVNTLLHEDDSEPAYQNYANGYNIYNSDTTDEDLDSYSDAVYEPKKQSSGILWLALLVIVIMAAILGVLGWLYMGGMLV